MRKYWAIVLERLVIILAGLVTGRRRWLYAVFMLLVCGMFAARGLPKPPLATYAPSSTAIYAANGRLLRLALSPDERYRLWLPLEQISPQLLEAFLLKEDQYFYWHPGVNPAALLRATLHSIGGDKQGASTISMQTARLIYRINSRSVGGKLRQIARALQLELMYSKHDILEAYLNLVPYGGNIEGVAAASLIHFGKRADNLSLPEVLALAVIPQAPTHRGSSVQASPSLLAARERLFELWCKEHPEAGEMAGLLALPLKLNGPSSLPFAAPHVTTMLLANNAYPGALVSSEINSSIDFQLQRTLERQMQRYLAQVGRTGINNAAAMLLDYRSMEVKAVLGSADFFNNAISGQVNGTLAKRSPGSALKPFIYALAADQGLIHPGSILKDTPTNFGAFNPENFDGGFVGPITATDALIRSRNVPAVSLMSRLSRPNLYDLLKESGVSRLSSESHYGLALALGGGEVTMEEMVSMYAMLANRGVMQPLHYRGLHDNVAAVRLLSEEASYMVLDMLQQNPRPDGINGARSGLRAAWKTGTSWGFRDAWSVGIFGPYVLAVWVGNFDGEGNPAFIGVQAAAPLFFRMVDAVQASQPNLAEPAFADPANLIQVEVCAASGDLPNVYCPLRRKTLFIAGKSPIRVSDIHRPVTIDTRTGKQACPPFDRKYVRVEVFEFWPSDIQRLFIKAGLPRRQPPELHCGQEAYQGVPPMITSPIRGVEYQLRLARITHETLPLTANAAADIRKVYWFVNDAFVGDTLPGNTLAWKPGRPGKYLVRAVDDQGRADVRELNVGISK
ncbi:MAG: penicillin-binding protein 1C [Gallionellaceae bacterium]